MANQENFKTDVTSESKQYSKYTVSRIIENLSDNLLQLEAPADFPAELNRYGVQLSVYSLADNSIIYETYLSNDNTPGVLYTKTLWYNDNGVRKLLFVDFSKVIGLNLPVGQVSITLNFFKNEVGSFDNQTLKVSNISVTRQEVELELTNTASLSELRKFATPYISAEYVQNAISQIFNQPNSSTLDSRTTGSKITSQSIATQLGETIVNALRTYGFDTGSATQPGVYQLAQTILNNAYPSVINQVQSDIRNNTSSFTSVYLNSIVHSAISNEYANVARNQQYRFILL